MQNLFYPSSIVIIGVSESVDNLGRNIVNNLDRFSFRGEVYLVGLKKGQLNGRTIYSAVEEVPGNPELAVILTPARRIPNILNGCGLRGIKWAVIESGGFSEYSTDGQKLEQQILIIARRHGIRFIGPNCIGIMNLDNGLILPFAILDPTMSRKGPISLISQSGGIATAVMKLFSCENLGFNKFISMGNKLDLNENDYLDYLIKDPYTSIIGLFLESISDGRQLMNLAMSTDKPIIILKANITSTSHDIARFHTSAMAGNDLVCEAAFVQAGIHRVHNYSELINYFKVFMLPSMIGPNLFAISRSGGLAVLAADAASNQGFILPHISKRLLDFVRSRVRSGVIHIFNPLDLGDIFDIKLYIDIIEEVLKEDEVHGVLIQHAFSRNVGINDIGRPIQAIEELSRKYLKPVVTCFLADRNEFFQIKASTNLPLFIDVDSALKALATSYRHAKRRIGEISVTSLKKNIISYEAAHLVNLAEIFSRFKSWGLSVADFILVGDLQSALLAANKIGYPVAIKIASTDILHKTEVDGVKLGIQDKEALEAAFREMEWRFSSMLPQSELKFLIQQMVSPGIEVILGGKRDPEFGPVILFGLGGIFTEIFQDIVIRVAPISEDQAREMIDQIRGSILLKGFRSRLTSDLEALSRTMTTFSKILIDFPEVSEVEINPLFVFGKGQGCIAVDGRMYLEEKKIQ